MAEACRGALAVADAQRAAEPRHLREYVAHGIFHVLARRRRRRADGATSVPAARAGAFRVRDEQWVVVRHRARFDEEGPCLDAVAQAFVDRAPQFRDASRRVGRAAGEARLCDIAPLNSEPEAVHAFVREPVEVGVRIVVDIVHQFVAEIRCAFYGAEEAARDAVFEPWLFDDGGEVSRHHAVFEMVDRAAHSVVVFRRERDAVWRDFDAIAFASRDSGLRQTEFALAAKERREVFGGGCQVARHAVVVNEAESLARTAWRRFGQFAAEGP